MIFRSSNNAFVALLVTLLLTFYQRQQRNLKDVLSLQLDDNVRGKSNIDAYVPSDAGKRAASDYNIERNGCLRGFDNTSIIQTESGSPKSDHVSGSGCIGENSTLVVTNNGIEVAEIVQINSNTTLVNDIERILHHPNRSTIEIHLKKSRKCQSPIFRGRISGPSLFIIEWSDQHVQSNDNNDDEAIVVGSYNLPPGRYFVEIIALLCSDIKYEEDFSSVCLENPDHHRVTVDDAFIDVRRDSEMTSENAALGKWIYNGAKVKHSHAPLPLHTRYQPQDCRDANKTLSRCTRATSIDRFQPYHFQWTDENYNFLNAEYLINITEIEDRRTVVCAVGASHSRLLVGFFNHHIQNSLEVASNHTNITIIPDEISFFWADAKFPKDITGTFVQNKIVSQQCTHIVIGLGQWAAGWPEGAPTLFPEYKDQMLKAIENIKSLTEGVKIYLRTIHYNPIGDQIGACPPEDWKSPVVIDGYNKILKGLADDDTSLDFLDTNFIISPMWDSAADWCHYQNEAGVTEALFILRRIISDIGKAHSKV